MWVLVAVMMVLRLMAIPFTRSDRSSGGLIGVPLSIRHTRTVPSAPPLTMTGVSASIPAATALTGPA